MLALDQLREAYAKIGGIDPASAKYEALTKFLDKQDLPTLKLLSGASIKWISPLALNRVNRSLTNEKR